jgi:transcriptional regulator with XRE-family HTH domain
MTRKQLAELRKRLEWNPAQMADALGIPGPQYNDIESGKAELSRLHELAIERVALSEAAARDNYLIAFPRLRAEARILARTVEGFIAAQA